MFANNSQKSEPTNRWQTARYALLLITLAIVSASLLVRVVSAAASSVNDDASQAAKSQELTIAGQRYDLTLTAANGAAIQFKSNNGESSGEQVAQESSLPHLVLLRNGALTPAEERTLLVTLTSQQKTSAAPVYIEIRLETQKGDPDRNSASSSRITAYQRVLKVEASVTQEITFGAVSLAAGELVDPNPTGYYRLVIRAVDMAGERIEQSEVVVDYAFLLENQWVAPLQAPESAGPQELLVYYTDMTPFQVNSFDPQGRLARQEVNGYIETVVIPGMQAVFALQQSWGFEWHPEWRGFRPEGLPGQLTVALTDRSEWYHGPAPRGGYGLIAINVNQYRLQTYSTLTDWIVSMFSHELFHNWQRSLNQHAGGQGDTEGRHDVWEVVTEGTALLVESLTRETLGFADGTNGSPYTARAAAFISRLESTDAAFELPFSTMSPYEMVVYWRYLYDSSRVDGSSQHNTSAGLAIIRRTLASLYSDKGLLDIQPQDLAAGFTRLMERVLEGAYAENKHGFGQALSGWLRDGTVESGFDYRFAADQLAQLSAVEPAAPGSVEGGQPAGRLDDAASSPAGRKERQS